MQIDLPICQACGVQYAAGRDDCPICLDERQYVRWEGQQWTNLAELKARGLRGRVEEEGPGVIAVGINPSFAIGQRALLVRTANGNVLWDATSYLDGELIDEVAGWAASTRS